MLLSLVVFRDLDTVLTGPAPRSAAVPISRVIKLSLILAALVGGISAKFYSCDYRYADLIGSPAALTMKVFGQIEGAFRWLLVFLLILAVIILVAGTTRTGTKKKGAE